MNKKKLVLIIINIIVFFVLICSILLPVDRKTAKYSNTDIDMYSGLSSVPVIGTITNNRKAELRFSVYNERLYGMSLFFKAVGKNTEGEINCILKFDDEDIEQCVIPVRELFALMNNSAINAKEIIFKSRPALSGEYILVLEGKNIDSQTQISLYGNNSSERYVDYVNADYQNYTGILYIVETLEEKRPYIWTASLILIMSLLFSYLSYSSDKEKKVETIG